MSEQRRRIYPSTLSDLEALLETATRPGSRARIEARIAERRRHNARRTNRRREALLARTPKQVAAARMAKHPTGSKTCARCGEVLPFAAFGDCPAATDGLWSSCTPCTERAQAERAES